MNDLKNRFFRFRRGTGANTSARRQAQKPSFGIKKPFRGSVAHAYSLRGKQNCFLPKYAPPPCSENHCFPIHFWTGKKGRIDRRKSPVFVQEIRMPLSRTPPLYSSSFTYSIRSAGWQSKRVQIVSRVFQETSSPCRNCCK